MSDNPFFQGTELWSSVILEITKLIPFKTCISFHPFYHVNWWTRTLSQSCYLLSTDKQEWYGGLTEWVYLLFNPTPVPGKGISRKLTRLTRISVIRQTEGDIVYYVFRFSLRRHEKSCFGASVCRSEDNKVGTKLHRSPTDVFRHLWPFLYSDFLFNYRSIVSHIHKFCYWEKNFTLTLYWIILKL